MCDEYTIRKGLFRRSITFKITIRVGTLEAINIKTLEIKLYDSLVKRNGMLHGNTTGL
jgi:hypothetical protein